MSRPLPSYAGTANATGPPGPPPAPDGGGEPVQVFLTVAVRTSAGAGPGSKMLPPAEAAALIKMKHAVYGSAPPGSYLGAL